MEGDQHISSKSYESKLNSYKIMLHDPTSQIIIQQKNALLLKKIIHATKLHLEFSISFLEYDLILTLLGEKRQNFVEGCA